MNRTRVSWLLLAGILLAVAIFEAIAYGWVATTVLVAFALLPDVALIGAFGVGGRLKSSRVRAYNALHSVWPPLVVMAVGILAPLPSLGWGLRGGLELFLAGLAWLFHIAIDRAAGFGLRARDGSIVPVGAAPGVR